MTTRIGWIKRRARRLQRFFHITRRLALVSASDDYSAWQGRAS